MAFTYNATSNRIFVDPDTTTEDLVITLDDVIAAYPQYVSKVNQTYFFSAFLILCGTATSRVELTVKSSILYFTAGNLGNDGGRLILGEKFTTVDGETYTKDGCLIILDGTASAYGTDPYQVRHSWDRSQAVRQYPICGEHGQVYMYDTKVNFINSIERNDMLDVPQIATEVEWIDCHFDGNDDYGAYPSYTHLFLVNMYAERVKISNFGVFELRNQTTKDWVEIDISKAYYGVSVYNGFKSLPVRLKDLKMSGVDFFGKKPGNFYLDLIDLNYAGSSREFVGTTGICNLFSSVDVTSVVGINPLEGARTFVKSDNNNVGFELLTDSAGVIPTQEILTEASEDGFNTFNVFENPFVFRAFKYGYFAIQIPTAIDRPTSLTASFVANPYITLTDTAAEAIDVDLIESTAVSLMDDPEFDNALVYGNTNTPDVWNTTLAETFSESGEIYTENGKLYFRRRYYPRADWNSGGIIYQTFNCTPNTDYTIRVVLEDMGGAEQFRMGFVSYNEYIMTEARTHTFTFNSGSDTSKTLLINAHGENFLDHIVVDSIDIFDPAAIVYATDDDGNEYEWTAECNGNDINDVYHKMQHLWGVPGGKSITYDVAEGLITDANGKFYGGKSILFNNFTGRLDTMIARDDTTFYFPSIAQFTLDGLQPDSEVRIFRADDLTELAGIENSGTTFTYSYQWSGDIDIFFVIHHENYGYIRTETTLTVNNTSIPIQQQFDRNYKNN